MSDNDKSTNGQEFSLPRPAGVERDDSDRELNIPSDLAAGSARTAQSSKKSDATPNAKYGQSSSSSNPSDLFKDLGISSPEFNRMSINISSNVNQLLNLKGAFDKKSNVDTVKNTGRFLEAGLAGPLLALIARYTGDDHYHLSNNIAVVAGGYGSGVVSSPAVCQWGCRALTNLAKNKVDKARLVYARQDFFSSGLATRLSRNLT